MHFLCLHALTISSRILAATNNRNENNDMNNKPKHVHDVEGSSLRRIISTPSPLVVERVWDSSRINSSSWDFQVS